VFEFYGVKLQCEDKSGLLVNARRNHDFLRELEQRNVRNETMALRDDSSCVIQANIYKRASVSIPIPVSRHMCTNH
jgi:hypothetical protein